MKKLSGVSLCLALIVTFANIYGALPHQWACNGGCVSDPQVPLCSCTDRSGYPPGSCVETCESSTFPSEPIGNCAYHCINYNPDGTIKSERSGQVNCYGEDCTCSKKEI